MYSTDPIADYLTRIRNAIRARHKRVDIPASNLKRDLTKILAAHSYIGSFTEIKDTKQNILRIILRYTNGESAISDIRRISKPGLRVYVPVEKLPRVLNGMGIAVVSTSRGMLTDKQAREQRVGGESISQVW